MKKNAIKNKCTESYFPKKNLFALTALKIKQESASVFHRDVLLFTKANAIGVIVSFSLANAER